MRIRRDVHPLQADHIQHRLQFLQHHNRRSHLERHAATGAETKVNFTFGYAKDDAGRGRIGVHPSSLPYAPHP